MPKVRLIALGDGAGDGGAAIVAARRIASLRADVDVEIEPGAGLAERLLAVEPIVVLEVLRSPRAAGSIVEVDIARVEGATLDGHPLSHYGASVPAAMARARERGTPLAHGIFLGVCGRSFEPNAKLSDDVIDAVVTAASGAIEALAD